MFVVAGGSRRKRCSGGSPPAPTTTGTGSRVPGADSFYDPRPVQRMIFDFLPKTDKAHDGAFDARGLSCLDMWHLLEVAVDPAYEGKGESAPLFVRPGYLPWPLYYYTADGWDAVGYCTLLLRDGFQRASGKPISLESTTPRSRDIYAHLGFEVRRSPSSHLRLYFASSIQGGCILGGQRTSVWCGRGRRDGHSG